MSDGKPREWWIIDYKDTEQKISTVSSTNRFEDDPCYKGLPVFHVIEYSAYEAVQSEITRLKRIIAKEFNENDELGSEFVYVGILRAQVEKAKEALSWISSNVGHNNHCEGQELKDCRAGCDGQVKAKEALKELEGD